MASPLKKASLFVALTFAASWVLAMIFYLSGGKSYGALGMAMLLAYTFIPMLAAVLVQKFIYRERVRGPLLVSFRPNAWWLVAWLLPPALAFAALGVGCLLPGVQYSPDMAGLFAHVQEWLPPERIARLQAQIRNLPVPPLAWGLIVGLVSGVTVNAVAAFGEELGWRGFLLKELSFLGFWRASLVIGLIWGIWHAFIIIQGYLFPQRPLEGIFMMTDFTLLFSPLIAYVTLKAKSVVAAAIMHGTLNGTAALAKMALRGGDEMTVGILGLAGLLVLVGANLLLFLYDRFLAPVRIDHSLPWS